MQKSPWTKPSLVSLAGSSDSEAGKYFNKVIEDALYSPSGSGFAP